MRQRLGGRWQGGGCLTDDESTERHLTLWAAPSHVGPSAPAYLHLSLLCIGPHPPLLRMAGSFTPCRAGPSPLCRAGPSSLCRLISITPSYGSAPSLFFWLHSLPLCKTNLFPSTQGQVFQWHAVARFLLAHRTRTFTDTHGHRARSSLSHRATGPGLLLTHMATGPDL